MKNRKTVVVAFMLCAVMLLGVGYAAFTDTLTVTGTIVADLKQAEVNYDANVYFSDVKFLASSSTGDKTQDSVGGAGTDDATFGIHSLAVLGEHAQVQLTIQNDSNVPVTVTMPEKRLSETDNNTNTNPSIFEIEYTYNGTKINVNTTNITVPSKGSVDIIATVTVIGPITVQTGATFGLDLKVTTNE